MRLKIAVAVTTLVVSTVSNAIELSQDWSLNGEIAAVSDYRSSGVSFSQGNPALQGYAVVSHAPTGLFVGGWASSFDVNTKTSAETAYYAGWSGAITDDVTLTASLGRWEYPRESSFDFTEFYGSLSGYGFIYNFAYDYDYKYGPNTAMHAVGYTYSLPYEANLYLEVGYNDMNYDIADKDDSTRQTFMNYEVKISKEMLGLNWRASYIRTDLSKTECSNLMGLDDVCNPTVVFGVSKAF